MYLHESVLRGEFLQDRKLDLLKRRIITLPQFIQLMEPDDPYIMIGPAIVDKRRQSEFMSEWKEKKFNLTPVDAPDRITSDEMVERIPAVLAYFPELKELAGEFMEKLESASCPLCVKNKYILKIAYAVKSGMKNREFSPADENLMKRIVDTYFPYDGDRGAMPLDENSGLDTGWLQDTDVGVGYDLIEGLAHCFDCCKKHLSRAKALQEELYLGYPDHKKMMFNEFTEANSDIEKAYSLYWDVLGQLDMASAELAGQLGEIEKDARCEVIELANRIRRARLAYQADVESPPDWDALRLDVQKLQNRLAARLKSV